MILPHDHLPLVTRELLYTGITRARTGVVIAGSRQVLVAGGTLGPSVTPASARACALR